MRTSLLVEYYSQLPQPREGDDAELWAAALPEKLDRFRRRVEAKYTEATLDRLLDSADPMTRRAAVVALSLLGNMTSNTKVAHRLQDPDAVVRQLASDALWAIWFRGSSEAENRDLQRVFRQRNSTRMMESLNKLVARCDTFAEAYNQRAILHYKRGDYALAVADCKHVLKLNPHHFGAAAGMAQCYLKMKKPRAALRAFRTALKINPNLSDVAETIRSLEDALGDR